MFKPFRGMNSLKGVGVEGKHPCLSLNIALSEEAARYMVRALVKLGKNMTTKKVDDFIGYKSSICYNRVCMRGKIKWDSTISQLPPNILEHSSAGMLHNMPAAIGGVFFFRCPRCHMVEPSSLAVFQNSDLDRTLKCSHCHKSTSIKY